MLITLINVKKTYIYPVELAYIHVDYAWINKNYDLIASATELHVRAKTSPPW